MQRQKAAMDWHIFLFWHTLPNKEWWTMGRYPTFSWHCGRGQRVGSKTAMARLDVSPQRSQKRPLSTRSLPSNTLPGEPLFSNTFLVPANRTQRIIRKTFWEAVENRRSHTILGIIWSTVLMPYGRLGYYIADSSSVEWSRCSFFCRRCNAMLTTRHSTVSETTRLAAASSIAVGIERSSGNSQPSTPPVIGTRWKMSRLGSTLEWWIDWHFDHCWNTARAGLRNAVSSSRLALSSLGFPEQRTVPGRNVRWLTIISSAMMLQSDVHPTFFPCNHINSYSTEVHITYRSFERG